MTNQEPGFQLRPGFMLVLILLLACAAWLRFSWIDWDQGYLLHPDERFLVSVTESISVPNSFLEYLDGKSSSLNPRNSGHSPYVYGDVPITLVRVALEALESYCAWQPSTSWCAGESAGSPGWISLEKVRITGRVLSAIAGIATLFWLTALARLLFGRIEATVALGFGGSCVFLIQQGYYFTADNFALFFTTMALFFLCRAVKYENYFSLVCAGLAAGFAIACRINLVPLLGLGILSGLLVAINATNRRLPRCAGVAVLVTAATMLSFRLAMPSAFAGVFSFDSRWVADIGWAVDVGSPTSLYPPSVQWINRIPWLFPLKDMVFWGMGLGLAISALAGWVVIGYRILASCLRLESGRPGILRLISKAPMPVTIAWLWTTAYFVWVGGWHATTMRYFLPIYPTFIVFAAWFVVRLWKPRAGVSFCMIRRIVAVALVSVSAIWTLAFIAIYQQPHPRIEASRWMQVNLPKDAAVGVEYWDDALPVGSKDKFRLLVFDHYGEDGPEKRERLIAWLQAVDYVVLSSNRLYTSIPRQPVRYPLASEYYRLLFSGELGFTPNADFSAYPRLAAWEFPDQEMGYAATLQVPVTENSAATYRVILPPADEAFSVYDHPRVIVFKKSPTFDAPAVARRLNRLDLETGLQRFSPAAESRAPTALQYSEETLQQLKMSGTWSAIFNRNDPLNQRPLLAVLAVYLFISLLGWLLWPLGFRLMPGLADRGFSMARTTALLLVGGGAWWLASYQITKFTSGTVFLGFVAMTAISLLSLYSRAGDLNGFIRERWRLMFTGELVFLSAFMFALTIRASNPDLWHPWFGGEKPMDFAILNAVLKSEHFPPHDPFFSGGYINYYYFGFVLAALPLKLLGIVPEVGYQIAMAMFYALAASGVFCLGITLARQSRKPIATATFAVFGVMAIGNLGTIQLILKRIIDSLSVAKAAVAQSGISTNFPAILTHARDSIHLELSDYGWFWDATRVIPTTGEPPPITEFPVFTLLYGDLHAHFMGLPLMLLALGVALSWWRLPILVSSVKTSVRGLLLPSFGGLVSGGLLMTNSWDFPTFTGLLLLALIAGILVTSGSTRLVSIIAGSFVFFATMLVFTLPFRSAFATGYDSIGWWQGSHTTPLSYFVIHGIFIVPILSLLWLERSDNNWPTPSLLLNPKRSRYLLRFFGGIAGVLLLAGILLYLPVLLFALPLGLFSATMALSPELSKENRAWAALVCCATCITLLVELIALENDVGRVNTVFKFYYQVWAIWGVCGAVACARIWLGDHRGARSSTLRWVTAGLFAGGLVYTLFAIPAHTYQRMKPSQGWGLDGAAFMKTAVHEENGTIFDLKWDRTAIRWLQENTIGTPVIAEGRSSREYQWGNRVSVHTGLPSILGWRYHVLQSRSILPPEVVELRLADVDRFYRDTDLEATEKIISRYGIELIYVGPLEQAYYPGVGLEKFERLVVTGSLRLLYSNPGVRIYQVLRSDGTAR